jgi:hypothetical protein
MHRPTPHADIDGRHLAVLLGALAGALALAWPFAEGGIVDDFAYVHMVKVLADTGRFAYNGWPTAMIGLQAWWAAAWVHLFGFSFTLVRLSVLPLAYGAVVLASMLARRACLGPRDSLFVGLTIAVMPLFFRLVPTFMTDLPALCFLLASLYAFTRAAEAPDRGDARPWSTAGWLVTATALALAGGTIRQNVWLAAPVGAACVAALRGTGRPARLAAAVCCVVGVACLLAGTRWFNRQPYAIPSQLTLAASPIDLLMGVGQAVKKALVQMLPGLAFCLPPLLAARVRSRTAALVWIGSAAVACCLLWSQILRAGRAGHPLPTFGLWGGLGETHAWARSLVATAWLGLRLTPVVAGVAVAGIELRCRGRAAVADLIRLPPALLITLAYLAAYTGAVALASRTTGGLFDRYVLPHIPILTIWMMLYTRRSLAAVPPGARAAAAGEGWGWAALAVAGAVAIADTHDSFAITRARLTAIARLEALGVPRERIMAGMSLDGWEQIERGGHVNDRRLQRPPGAYRPLPPDGDAAVPLRGCLPLLVPEYIVTADPLFFPGDGSPLPEVPFTTWLPPYDQQVRVHHQPSPAPPPPADR